MKYCHLGWRRVYECIHHELPGISELNGEIPLADGMSAAVRVGKSSKYGTSLPVLPEYSVVGEPVTWESVDHSGKVLLEIIVKKKIEITHHVEERLRARDADAVNDLIKTLNDDFSYSQILDAIAGSLGVFIDKQMVMKKLAEGPFYEYRENWTAVSSSNEMTVLEHLVVTDETQIKISDVLRMVSAISGTDLASLGGKAHWLLKAWNERDPIARFVYSFIPLEALLPKGEPDGPAMACIATIRDLIPPTHTERQALDNFLNVASRKFGSSLVDRFSAFAAKHGAGDWKEDKDMFKKLNRRRNTLLHQGSAHINLYELNEQTKLLLSMTVKYLKLAYLKPN